MTLTHRPFAPFCASLALTLLAGASNIAHAESMYFLGSIGNVSYGGGTQNDNDTALANLGKTGIQSSINTTGTAYKAIFGYQFTPNLAVEGGYMDLGSVDYNASFSGGSIRIGKMTGLNMAVVGLIPANYQLSLFGKVGYTLGNVEAVGPSGAGSTVERNGIGMGVGGIYQITPTVGVRLEWEKLYSDINLLSLGMQLKF